MNQIQTKNVKLLTVKISEIIQLVRKDTEFFLILNTSREIYLIKVIHNKNYTLEKL